MGITENRNTLSYVFELFGGLLSHEAVNMRTVGWRVSHDKDTKNGISLSIFYLYLSMTTVNERGLFVFNDTVCDVD